MTARASVRLLPPQLPFTAVHGAFVDGGWSGGPVTLTAPLVADEPEVARYRREGEVATYAVDPVVWLRTVATDATSSLPDLPWVSPTEVLAWLATVGSTEPARERRLLGVLASGELGLRRAVPALRRLAAADDALVAAAARRVLSGLAQPSGSR